MNALWTLAGMGPVLALLGVACAPPEPREAQAALNSLPLRGLAGAYTDPAYLTGLDFGQHSHWLQPWRAFLETVPAAQFLNGVGIGFPTSDGVYPEPVAQMLAKNGFRTVRVEVGWGNINFEDETRLNNAGTLGRILAACRRWKLRPLILLNLHQGVPTPLEMFDRAVLRDAPKGSTRLELDSTGGLVPGRSGLSDLTDYWAAEVLVTAVQGQSVTLSKPLPVALKAGVRVKMATLKYRPFSAPGSADYEQTMAGWTRYMDTVSRFVTAALGTAGQADLGFDLEVYNELTFGAQFLSVNNYYQPPLEKYDQESIWSTLVEATARHLAARPQAYAGVALGNGFSNTIPWPASSGQPARVGALGKHPYHGPSRFPADEPKGEGLGQRGQPTDAVPTYTALFPEYYGTALQTETLLRDSAPLKTDIYGTVHGRFGRGPASPVEVWMTEANLSPEEAGVTDPAAARALKARSAARYFTFFLNKGVGKLHLYSAIDGEGTDTGYSVLQANFVQYARSNTVYPDNDAPYTSPALLVTRRLTDAFKVGLDPGLRQTRPLQVRSLRDSHDHVQFPAVGDQPPLHNREVFTVLPYQVNARRFVIAYYVMTRDLRQPLKPEAYTLELGGLRGEGARISVSDPMNGGAVPVDVQARGPDSLALGLLATDTPRLLIVEER